MTRPINISSFCQRLTLCFALVFCVLLASQTAFARLTVSLQTAAPEAGKPVVIYLQTSHASSSEPDLSQLPTSLELLDIQTVTVTSYSTGKKQISTRWVIRLRPLKSGTLTLPPLTAGDETSPALPFQVTAASETPNIDHSEPAEPYGLNLQLQPDQIYRNSQLLVTLQLHQRNNKLGQVEFIPPQSTQFLIRPLATTQPATEPTPVISQRFALFPRQAGQLELPTFTVRAIDDAGQSLELASDPAIVTVLEPAFESSRGLWLPARQLIMNDILPLPAQLLSGESFTRELIIRADGLPAASLPALMPLQVEQARIELLSVNLTEDENAQGLTGERREIIRVTPQQVGTLTLPAIDLPWWQTTTRQGQHAVLPARSIQVVDRDADPKPDSTSSHPTETPPPAAESGGHLLIWLLTLFSLASTLALIYSVHRLYRLRKPVGQSDNPAVLNHPAERTAPTFSAEPVTEQSAPAPVQLTAEEKAFHALATACHQSDAQAARLALLNWSQLFWRDNPPDSLEQIGQRAENKSLNLLIMELEQCLYAGQAHNWQGTRLLEGLQKLRL